MIHSSRWRSGFLASALLLIWTIVFWSFLSSYLSMGPALGFFFLTVGIFILMTLLMLAFVFFRKTRLMSFGMAIPLLVLQIGLLILTLGFASWGVLMNILSERLKKLGKVFSTMGAIPIHILASIILNVTIAAPLIAITQDFRRNDEKRLKKRV